VADLRKEMMCRGGVCGIDCCVVGEGEARQPFGIG
jgi:hypothetical protein